MKLRDAQWIVEPALPDAKATGSAGGDAVAAQLPAGVEIVLLDSLERLEAVSA